MRPTTKFDNIKDYQEQNLVEVFSLNNLDRSTVRDYKICFDPKNNQWICTYFYWYKRDGKKCYDIRQKSFDTIDQLIDYLGSDSAGLHYSEFQALVLQLEETMKQNNNLVFRERK